MSHYCYVAIFVAIAGSIIASYTDVKTKEIPNYLTFSMIFLGLLFFSLKFYREWIFFIPLIASYFLIWFIWRAGMWGGGDAKLMMGLMALLPPCYGIHFIPLFFIMVAFVSLIHYSIFGMIQAIKERKGKIFASAMILMVATPLFSYFLLKSLSRSIAIIISLILLFIIGDIASSFLPCRKKVRISDKIAGEILAEIIYVREGKIVRVKREPSLIMNLIKGRKIKGRGIDIILEPKYTGISKEDIKILKKCCNDVLIFISYPMAPIILAALLLILLFGREIFSILAGF